MANIVVTGVDASPTALEAAKKAAAVADAFGSDLYVLSAFNANAKETVSSIQGRDESEALTKAYKSTVSRFSEIAEQTASAVAENLRASYPGLTIVPKAVEGTPAQALGSEAERLNADLIVVGNKRVQGPARILGSIAKTVSSEAACDVYIVNTHQR